MTDREHRMRDAVCRGVAGGSIDLATALDLQAAIDVAAAHAEEQRKDQLADARKARRCAGQFGAMVAGLEAVEKAMGNPDPVCADCGRDLPADGYCECNKDKEPRE